MLNSLILISLVALPFTQALTINIKFPLKIYEVCLFFASALMLTRMRIAIAPTAKREIRILAFFWVAATIMFLVRIISPAEGITVSGFISRFGPMGDGAAKLLYLMLSFLGFAVFSCYAYWEEERFTKAWLIGAWICALYTWYLFLSSLLGLQPILLPGMDGAQRLSFGAYAFIRSGTFEEGNFLGLYLLLSACLALHARRIPLAVFLAATVLVSASTASLFGMLLMIVFLALRGIRQRKSARQRLAVLLSVIIFIALAPIAAKTTYVRSVIMGKMTTSSAGSGLDRLDHAIAALRMFADHPLIGVGLSQYGYFYERYKYYDIYALFHMTKRIPNNVYLEVLSELGLIGFLLFGWFLVSMYQRLRDDRLHMLRYGFYAILFIFLAYPSYSVMFSWAFFGLVTGVSAKYMQEIDKAVQ